MVAVPFDFLPTKITKSGDMENREVVYNAFQSPPNIKNLKPLKSIIIASDT
jgi:hypothetical protein